MITPIYENPTTDREKFSNLSYSINCLVGDLAGNAKLIFSSVVQAKAQGATLVVTPELSLCGYPPEDLLLRTDFLDACDSALKALATQLAEPTTAGLTVVIGHPLQIGGACFNAASVLQDGRVVATYHKQTLPNYGVFDEKRYFTPGSEALVFNHQGVKIGLLICADVWETAPALKAKVAGAELLLVLNASPFHLQKQSTRYDRLRQRVFETQLPIIYTNMALLYYLPILLVAGIIAGMITSVLLKVLLPALQKI